MKNTGLLVLILTGLFFGCQNRRDGIHQLWFYTFSSDSSFEQSTLSPSNFIELRPDQTFTSDLGKFHAGRWSQKDQQLFLNADDGNNTILYLNDLKQTEMQIQIGNATAANFDGQPLPAVENDPFSMANNLWRKPATTRESDDQLRGRLKNHCGFWVSYFTWALKNELSTVDVRSTPTPIKIYGNGFTIKPLTDLPPAWKEYFYDSADCKRANDMLENLVRTRTIAWAHTDNKYKMFISAFQQMEHFLGSKAH